MNYSALVDYIAPYVTGCPSPVIEQVVREICIDLCETTGIYRYVVPDIPLVAGTSTYTPTLPTDTEISHFFSAKLLDSPVEVYDFHSAYLSFPLWPDVANPGQPVRVFPTDFNTIGVDPVPDAVATYTMSLYVSLRPTLTSVGIADSLAAELRRALRHGVLESLAIMPDKTWTDEKKSVFHGKKYSYETALLRAKAEKGLGRQPTTVSQRPFA